MKTKRKHVIENIYTFSPLAGIIGASFLSLSDLQHQILMLLLLVWANAFFVYRSWLSQ